MSRSVTPMRLPRRTSSLLALAAVVVLSLGAASGPVAARPVLGAPSAAGPAASSPTKVLIVTLDALGSNAVRRLGPERLPTLHRLMREGASTRNARTARELTLTLPNHTSLVTGRRVEADHRGHGVFWNDDRLTPRTVQKAAGHGVASVFSVVDSDRRDPALFTSKRKLSLFERSWPKAVDTFVLRQRNPRLVRDVRADLVEHRRALTFLHLSLPDDAGHRYGFTSAKYLDAAERVDRLLGKVITTIEARPKLRENLTLIVTADHGSTSEGHFDPSKPGNFRVPFVVWGVGVEAGAALYALNDDYRDPGNRRTTYAAKRPPVRNGDAANLATRLLGLGRIPHSEFGFDRRLHVS